MPSKLGKGCYSCYSTEVAVTLIGFLHLNAALYFWARASTFEPIYMWIDILVAAMYTIRATYFFIMLNLDATTQSRVDYFEYNKLTGYGLAFCGFSISALKWIEWSHPPTWTLVAWAVVALFNYYHWYTLEDYAGLSASSKVEMTEVATEDNDEAMAVEGDNTTTFIAVNKIE